jgi:GDP-4-dehydro-6-deoxy-D-mannose reductase
MSRVLVTGAAGFAGRHAIRELARRGWTVFGAAREADRVGSPEEAPGDVAAWLRLDLDREGAESGIDAALREARPDAVLHLAAQSNVARAWADPVGTWRVNVLGTVRLVNALRRQGVPRLVFASSGDVYGKVATADLPIRESQRPAPNNPYAASKLAAEAAVAQFGGADGPEVVLLRLFAHTGPGQSPDFACPAFARQIARAEAGLQAPSVRTGNLDARRDFSDVRDIARAYADALERAPAGEPLNVCSGKAWRVGDALAALVALSTVAIDVGVDPEKLRPVDSPEIRGDGSRFQAATGWAPSIPFERTLADLLDAERANAARELAAAGASAAGGRGVTSSGGPSGS